MARVSRVAASESRSPIPVSSHCLYSNYCMSLIHLQPRTAATAQTERAPLAISRAGTARDLFLIFPAATTVATLVNVVISVSAVALPETAPSTTASLVTLATGSAEAPSLLCPRQKAPPPVRVAAPATMMPGAPTRSAVSDTHPPQPGARAARKAPDLLAESSQIAPSVLSVPSALPPPRSWITNGAPACAPTGRLPSSQPTRVRLLRRLDRLAVLPLVVLASTLPSALFRRLLVSHLRLPPRRPTPSPTPSVLPDLLTRPPRSERLRRSKSRPPRTRRKPTRRPRRRSASPRKPLKRRLPRRRLLPPLLLKQQQRRRRTPLPPRQLRALKRHRVPLVLHRLRRRLPRNPVSRHRTPDRELPMPETGDLPAMTPARAVEATRMLLVEAVATLVVDAVTAVDVEVVSREAVPLVPTAMHPPLLPHSRRLQPPLPRHLPARLPPTPRAGLLFPPRADATR